MSTGAITLASKNGSGQLGDIGGGSASLAGDGTKVSFQSASRNLLPADTATWDYDIYVKDLTTGNLILASATASGTKSNGTSNWSPRLSSNGAKVAFSSNATNLHGSDNDTVDDVYVKDLVTGDLTLGSTAGVGTKGNGNSWTPSLSADATTLAFVSFSTNLDPADTDASADIYVKDLTSGILTLASTNVGGVKGNSSSGYDTSLNGAGSRVAFASHATNLHPQDFTGHADVYVKELSPGVPATLTLSPETATNNVGTTHTVTATVEDAAGNRVPGVTVRFSVPTAGATHADPSSGSATTDGDGEAAFSFSASPSGDDTIHAFADTNNDGDEDTGEPSDSGSKTWVAPASTEGCKIIQSGSIIANNGDQATFRGNAIVEANGSNVWGQQNYRDHGPAQPRLVESMELTSITCSQDATRGTIFGRATIDGAGDFDFRIDVVDEGRGTNDSYGIILSDGYASGQKQLQRGNVQIQKQ